MEDSIPDEIQHKMFIINGANRNFSQNLKNLIQSGNNVEVMSNIKGINPSLLVDSNKTSLLHLAAEYNNCDIAKDLIELKFDVNAKDTSNRTPLIVAVRSGKFYTAKLLIQANADIYDAKLSNQSVLQTLLNNNSTPQYLIDSCLEKVKSDSLSDEEIAEKLSIAKCPLNIVVYLRMPNVTRMFMEHSDQIDREQGCAAMLLALQLENIDNILALLEGGVGVDLRQIRIASFILLLYLTNADVDGSRLTNAFLEKVIDWSFLTEDDVNNIERLFETASKNILQLLLQHNIHIHMKNKFPERNSILTIFGNRNADSRELLKHLEFDVNSHMSDSGPSALHYAANIGAVAEVQTLLNLGANPNCQDSNGRTPLFFVGDVSLYEKKNLDSEEKKVVELLLLAGADVQLSMMHDFYQCRLPFCPTKSQMILAQLAIDESLGTPIKKSVRCEINKSQKSIETYQTYCQKIEKLKATKVQGSVTLYDVLVMHTDKITNCIRDREIVQAITQSSDVKELHFFYVSKLEYSVTKILHTMDLREKAAMFMCEVAGWPDSQYIVLEKILSFLTYKDLLVFDLL